MTERQIGNYRILKQIGAGGIAKGKTDPQMTIVGTATGTPEYMAPEQFGGGEHLD